MNEILDILDEEDDNFDVYIEPPEPNDLTDEDSAKEGDEPLHPYHLSGNQLLVPAEMRQRSGNKSKNCEINNNYTSDDESEIRPSQKKKDSKSNLEH